MFFIISVPTTNYKNAQKVCIPLKSCAAINKEKAPRSDAPGGFGPSGATRTRGFHIPNVAPYQLGYTRIFNFYHYTTAEGKSKIFLSVVIPVVKSAFMPLSTIVKNPANTGVTRLCGVSPCPAPDSATALPKQARYQLRYTRKYRHLTL